LRKCLFQARGYLCGRIPTRQAIELSDVFLAPLALARHVVFSQIYGLKPKEIGKVPNRECDSPFRTFTPISQKEKGPAGFPTRAFLLALRRLGAFLLGPGLDLILSEIRRS
jgi:hypothetical protein